MRESAVEQYLVDEVKRLGGEIRKVKWPGRRGGTDRVVFFPEAIIFWVETKSLTGVVKIHQSREHARLRKMGQKVYVCNSKEQVDSVLRIYFP